MTKMEDSIFHKFATGEIKPSTQIRYEDEEMLAFDDLHPATPTHVLIIPKSPLESIAQMEVADSHLVGKMIYRAKLIAEELGLASNGYRITINVGKWGGQVVPYLHVHLLGGTQMHGNLKQFSKDE